MALTALGALVVALNTDTALALLVPQGAWPGDIPEEYSLPLVSVKQEGETPAFTSEGPYVETSRFRITALAEAPATVAAADPTEQIAMAIKNVLDTATLAVANASHMSTIRTGYDYTLDAKRSPHDLRVYRAVIQVEIRLERQRPLAAS